MDLFKLKTEPKTKTNKKPSKSKAQKSILLRGHRQGGNSATGLGSLMPWALTQTCVLPLIAATMFSRSGCCWAVV